MAYLIDTCVLSELVRKRPEPRVVRWTNAADERTLYLSSLTLGELEKGIAKLAPSTRRSALEAWVAVDLPARFLRRVLPISTEVAIRWGRISGDAERRGAPLPVIDALLAATALSSDLTVVTRNTSDIERAGARVLNPFPR